MSVQYTGGRCSTREDLVDWGYHEYSRTMSWAYQEIPWVHRRVHRGVSCEYQRLTMISVGGYHEYTRGCSVHQTDTISSPWHTVMSVGISWVHREMLSTLECRYKFSGFINDLPHSNHSIAPPPPPRVLMISPTKFLISPVVLNIPQCTAYTPSVLQRLNAGWISYYLWGRGGGGLPLPRAASVFRHKTNHGC